LLDYENTKGNIGGGRQHRCRYNEIFFPTNQVGPSQWIEKYRNTVNISGSAVPICFVKRFLKIIVGACAMAKRAALTMTGQSWFWVVGWWGGGVVGWWGGGGMRVV
jgi:hypothetical protein